MTTNIPNISLNEGSLISYAELSAFYFLLAVIPVAKKSRKLWRRSEQFYSPVSEEEARNLSTVMTKQPFLLQSHT
jgi:hypothetical protein